MIRDLGPLIERKSILNIASEGGFVRRLGSQILCLLFVPLFILILRDRRALPWDEAFYARHSFALFHVLIQSPGQWASAAVHVLGDRAPALVWIGQFFVPLGGVFPHAQTALLLAMLSIQAGSVLLLFKALVECFGQKRPAFLAAFLVITGSLFTGLTYRYFVDPLQVTAVVWLLILAVSYQRMNTWIFVVQLISALCFGLLVKTSTPLYQLPLIIYLVVVFLRGRLRQAEHPIPTSPTLLVLHLVLAGVLLLGTVSWYETNFSATYQHVVQAASGDLSIYYGRRGDLSTKLLFWFDAFVCGFFGKPLSILLLSGLALAIIRRIRSGNSWAASDLLAAASFIWITVVLILFSRTINEDTRYLIGLAPYVGVLAAWICKNARSGIFTVVFAALLTFQMVNVTARAFGRLPPSPQLSTYLQPYVSDSSALEDELFATRVTADATPLHPLLVGCETAQFNGEGLAFYRQVQAPAFGLAPLPFVAFDWTQSSLSTAWTNALASRPRYYAYRKNIAGDASVFNRLSEPMLAKVQASSSFLFVPEKSNSRVLIYEATADKTLKQAAATADARSSLSDFQGTNPDGSGIFGFLDYPKAGEAVDAAQNNQLAGWTVSKNGINFVDVQVDEQPIFHADKMDRPDVVNVYPAVPSTGYKAEYQFSAAVKGIHKIRVIAHSASGKSRVIASISVDAIPVNR